MIHYGYLEGASPFSVSVGSINGCLLTCDPRFALLSNLKGASLYVMLKWNWKLNETYL